MNIKTIIPKPPEILREAIIVVAGALLAAWVARQLPPQYQSWFKLPGQQ